MWSVAHARGYITPADFVRGRYGSRGLSLAVAVTGILATMPYIALQLVGIEAVVDTVGLGGSSNAFLRDLPLIIAFAVLAAYTYSSGLRAPALIAFVKDTLVYVAIVAAIVYVGWKIGIGPTFRTAETKMNTPTASGKKTGVFIPANPNAYWACATLAFGSAMALFMYPHAMTATPAARSRRVIRRNAAILPTYSLMLAPLFMDKQNAINLQLLGGVWILQTFLAIVAGLCTRWFHRWALLVGWAAAMVWGTVTAYNQTVPNTKTKLVDGKPVTTVHGVRHFGSSVANFPFTHVTMYIAISALVTNIVVAVALTMLLRAIKAPDGGMRRSPTTTTRMLPSRRWCESMSARRSDRADQSGRYSLCAASMVTSASRIRMRTRRLSGAMSPPQQRATSDFTSCSRPY
jgi:hypothetical protein